MTRTAWRPIPFVGMAILALDLVAIVALLAIELAGLWRRLHPATTAVAPLLSSGA